MQYQDLKVYRQSLALALRVHRLTFAFPAFEQPELARQLRRSTKSIVSNLVEGVSRYALSKKEQRRFLVIAIGSADESKLWIVMAGELGYLAGGEADLLLDQLNEIGRMLYGLWKKRAADQPGRF